MDREDIIFLEETINTLKIHDSSFKFLVSKLYLSPNKNKGGHFGIDPGRNSNVQILNNFIRSFSFFRPTFPYY